MKLKIGFPANQPETPSSYHTRNSNFTKMANFAHENVFLNKSLRNNQLLILQWKEILVKYFSFI